MLRDTLMRIASELPSASEQVFARHPLAAYLRGAASDQVQAGLGELAKGLICDGSGGAGNWAAIPWLAVFDPIVTTSATRGYYVVYLFSPDGKDIHLSLNQGTTAVYEEYKGQALEVLRDRAALMRARLSDYVKEFDTYDLSLGSKGRLPTGYEAGHAFGRRYQLSELPDEATLRADLQRLTQAYLSLTFRGGPAALFTDAEGEAEHAAGSPIEIRRYRLHRRIDRRGQASAAVKDHHGLICQACGFDFLAHYGELGRGYIEAHHLKPLGTLVEGVPVTFDIAEDFAVLCANCHRMIHRTDDPSDLEALRRILTV